MAYMNERKNYLITTNMRKILKFALCAACVMSMAACGGQTEISSDKEETLQRAMTPYVNNTVIATYSGMSDEGLVLLNLCEQILAAQEAGQDYSALMTQAQTSWRAMRKFWEQSEAFLYGPASTHSIDPHIDSWPLDFNAMNALLNNAEQMAQIEEEGGAYVGDKLGYALKGFHAAEYLLFTKTTLTHPEAVYLVGIVEDLTQQAILLEYCWADEVSAAKQALLEEGDIEPWEDRYGWQMINAGKPGSIFVTYQEAAEDIVAGCADIADEVAKLKMGNPYLSSTEEQREYIESPYSYTSTIDFADNIRSIEHAYCGSLAGDYSISNYVSLQDADLDSSVRQAITDAIAAIEAIKNFETTAQGNTQVKAAMDKVAALEEILSNEVLPLLSK